MFGLLSARLSVRILWGYPKGVYLRTRGCDQISKDDLAPLSFDSTATGEYGIGNGKSRFIKLGHGVALEVLREFKQTLDPNCILNPGKIFP